jgi:hypothetical protein
MDKIDREAGMLPSARAKIILKKLIALIFLNHYNVKKKITTKDPQMLLKESVRMHLAIAQPVP